VAVGTANFIDPSTALRVVDGIGAYLVRHQMRAISDLTGALKLGKE
jgi:dihydroorotate dehydrogenase (NAD+) catalytic subunit